MLDEARIESTIAAMDPRLSGYAAGFFGLLLYAGARLGWWAPESTGALNRALGRPGLLERTALKLALAALAAWIVWLVFSSS